MCAAYGAELPSEPPEVLGAAALVGFHRDCVTGCRGFGALICPTNCAPRPPTSSP